MDITALSPELSLINTQTQVGMKVLSMEMDTMREQSDGMQKVLEMSVNPNVGSKFDVSV